MKSSGCLKYTKMRMKWTSYLHARANYRIKLMQWAHGRSKVSWSGRWMHCDVRPPNVRLPLCQEESADGWHYVACCYKNPMSYCLMNPLTTLMRNLSIGSNNTYSNIRGRLLL